MNSGVFFLLSTLCTVLNRALMTFIIVGRASSVHKVVKECVSIACRVSLKHIRRDVPFFVKESRQSLRQFLSQEQSPVSLTAGSMFKLDISLVLTFMNTIIPFTVMFVTTTYQVMSQNAFASKKIFNCTS